MDVVALPAYHPLASWTITLFIGRQLGDLRKSLSGRLPTSSSVGNTMREGAYIHESVADSQNVWYAGYRPTSGSFCFQYSCHFSRTRMVGLLAYRLPRFPFPAEVPVCS